MFIDSSIKAYGMVAYLHITASPKDVIVASKNRVAPLKILTLNRLELIATLMSAKLSSNILKVLKLKILTYYWT